MAALTGYIHTLLVVVVLGFLLELLVPGKAFQGYVRLIIGLVVMVALLNPLLGFLGHRLSLWPWGSNWDQETASLLQEGQILAGERNADILRAYRQEVAAAAEQAALAVPGVRRAQATVTLANGTSQASGVVAGIRVVIAGEPKPGKPLAAWQEEVRSRVAAGLGLSAEQVSLGTVKEDKGESP